jgi:hypothetical protein
MLGKAEHLQGPIDIRPWKSGGRKKGRGGSTSCSFHLPIAGNCEMEHAQWVDKK